MRLAWVSALAAAAALVPSLAMSADVQGVGGLNGPAYIVTWPAQSCAGVQPAASAIDSATIDGTVYPAAWAIVLFGNPFTIELAPTLPAGTLERVTTNGRTFFTCGSDRFLMPGFAAPSVNALTPASGPLSGGTAVVITGANLGDATSVSFGGTPATSFSIDSATQITAIAPAHAPGSANVIVTTSSGDSIDTAADDYAFMPAPVPTMTEWAMILFGLILAGGAAVMIQRRARQNEDIRL